MAHPHAKNSVVAMLLTSWGRLPSLIRLVLLNAVVGGVLGAGFAIALLMTNAFGLATLIAASDDKLTPVALLVASLSSLISALVVATAVMRAHRAP